MTEVKNKTLCQYLKTNVLNLLASLRQVMADADCLLMVHDPASAGSDENHSLVSARCLLVSTASTARH